MKILETFDITRINDLVTRARQTPSSPDEQEEIEGWSKSVADPTELLSLFLPLRLREGFVLRAYQYCSGGNGNAIVFAVPAGSDLPEPNECRPSAPDYPEAYSPVPAPPNAHDDFMSFVEGDDTPWSYLLASLLARELWEFGAMWHGCEWSTHTILGTDPFTKPVGTSDAPLDGPTSPVDMWQWDEHAPADWRPVVGSASGRTVVRFYTYTGLGCEQIVRHTDTYGKRGYVFEPDAVAIGHGQGGFVF